MERSTAAKIGCLVMGGLLLAAPTRRVEDFGDFIGNYNFRVEIDGVDAGHFKSVDGLSIELEVIEYRDGDDPVPRKRPGRVKFGDITLKKGYISTPILNDWIEAARCGNGDYTRKNMSIVLCDSSTPTDAAKRQPVCSEWVACNVFPRRWKLNPRDQMGKVAVVTEEITFAVEELIYEPRIYGRECKPPQIDPPR